MTDIEKSIITAMAEAMVEEIPPYNDEIGRIYDAAIVAYRVCIEELAKNGMMEKQND